MEFGNGNSYDLALLAREYVCACGGGEKLSAANLKSHLTKIRTYHLLPSWCPSRSTNLMCTDPIAAGLGISSTP